MERGKEGGGVGDKIGLPTQACCLRGVFRRHILNPWHAWRALLVSTPQFLAPKPQISCSKPQILNSKPQTSRPKTSKRAQKSQTPIHSTEPPTRVACVFSLPNPFLAPKPQNSCLKPHYLVCQTPKFQPQTPNFQARNPKPSPEITNPNPHAANPKAMKLHRCVLYA